MEQRLSFITLGVADLDRSRAFYEALGWTASAYGDGKDIVFFQVGGLVLALIPREELAEDANVSAEGSGFSGITLSHNVRSEAEVDATLAEAVAAGARLLRPGSRVFWGGYMGYFADPDGHNWEVCFNPQVPVQGDGTVRLPG
jgi:catechol 2,3-dioxygenase-like lactoylglutathione lyase family enzyme